jgi:16S rRNA (uracil1498-N3)-methyltransferase
VNLLLVEPAELATVVVVRDRRAEHLRTVLGVKPGTTVRAGVIGGQIGTADVLSDDGVAIELRLTLTEPPPAPLPIQLVLAVPRPKVLSRVVEAVAAFGIARLDLTNAWRVDKSYLSSPRLAPGALAAAARLGAEQGATTYLPPIALHARLMALLADLPQAATRLVAHPGAPLIETATLATPVTLALGPEGGWIAREVDTLVERGFQPVSLGTGILRVETAVAAALGQLALLLRAKR